MTHIHYNVISTHVNGTNTEADSSILSQDGYTVIPVNNSVTYEDYCIGGGDSLDIHETKPVPPVKQEVPGWMHIDPINTQIDLQSVADQLSDYKFTPGFKVTVDNLTNPEPLDYEATPANL